MASPSVILLYFVGNFFQPQKSTQMYRSLDTISESSKRFPVSIRTNDERLTMGMVSRYFTGRPLKIRQLLTTTALFAVAGAYSGVCSAQSAVTLNIQLDKP